MQRSVTLEIMTGCGKVFITKTHQNIFIAHGSKEFGDEKKCPCGESNLRAFCDLINVHSEHGGDMGELAEAFKGHACPKRIVGKDGAKSCSDAFARVLEQFVELGKDKEKKEEKK